MHASSRPRLILLCLFVGALAAAIAARLFQLQVARGDSFRDRAEDQYQSRLVIPATRGAILARDGEPLAMSMDGLSLYAHPQRVADPARAATILAPVLGVPRSELLSRLRSRRPFVYLKRFLEPGDAERVRAAGLPIGDAEPFGLEKEPKRVYPRGHLGAHVVGYATVDGEGVEGIELQFDEQLRGDPTVYLVLQDARNGKLRELISEPRRRPHDVQLTLDAALQHIVERELDRALRDTGAEAASAVLLDPASGEILALANRPSPDPNQFGRASEDQRTNRAATTVYEPGSTFKIVPMAAALDRNRVHSGQQVYCENGVYNARGRVIHDVTRHGLLTLQEILEKSSNIGMVKIAQSVSARELWDSIGAFGFGSKTGIELPGESRGILQDVSRWSGFSHASLAFGQEIGVTALQMAAAIGVVANDGVYVPPHVVLGTRDGWGRLTPLPHPAPRRAIRPSTARAITRMLEGVVHDGTGKRGAVSGYRVAGKSGTAQRAAESGGYAPGQYVASFGGFGPVSAPRIVALVVLHAPRGAQHQGGQVAAPVFSRIVGDALRYLRVPPDGLEDDASEPPETLLTALRPDGARVPARKPIQPAPAGAVPDVLGAGLREAVVALARSGCQAIVVGSGVVQEQEPAPGSALPPERTCRLRLAEVPVESNVESRSATAGQTSG